MEWNRCERRKRRGQQRSSSSAEVLIGRVQTHLHQGLDALMPAADVDAGETGP